MRNLWLRFGCFLIGYNYHILKACSENSVRRVLRYTSALIIPCLIWAFVGYFFGRRYLLLDPNASLVVGLIMVVLVIQIERQVILSSGTNKVPLYFRTVIAIMMALIGSLIMDQILFKEDIEKERIGMIEREVDELFPSRARELTRQIGEMESTIVAKEKERTLLVDDVSRNPTIPVYTRQVTTETKDTITSETVTRTASRIENPKIALLDPLDVQIAGLRVEKLKKDSMLLVLRPMLKAELEENVGFLDELQLMFSILLRSPFALGVWILFFLFLLGIEAFILVSKWKESETDYDVVVTQQEMLHRKKLELLTRL